MHERRVVRVRPDLEAARSARNALARLLDDLPGDVVDQARILVSELVSNSVRHAGLCAEDWIEVSVYVRQGCLRVEVDDPGTTLASATDETWFHDRAGWGFILLSELASRWSIQRAEQTSAWFEIDF